MDVGLTATNTARTGDLDPPAISDVPPVETFVNDSTIGRPGKNKVELVTHDLGGVDTANRPNQQTIVRFYSMTPRGDWVLKQALEFQTYSISGQDPQIDDFNNDKLNDLTFVSTTAARRANEVRMLLLYDEKLDELVALKNSENYPNMLYNKKLNCIDAWLFHGATTTVFLKIDGDMLREVARVDTGSELVVSVVGRDGVEREIYRKPMNLDDVYTRYIDFNPPTPYKEDASDN